MNKIEPMGDFDLEEFKPIKTLTKQSYANKVEYGLFKGQEVVVKRYIIPLKGANDFRQEVSALNILKDNLNTPNLILCDEKKLLVVMSYCGAQSGYTNAMRGVLNVIPPDFLKKVINLYNQIGEDYGVWHGDLHMGNITLIGDKLYLIDWARFGTKPSPKIEKWIMRLWKANGCGDFPQHLGLGSGAAK